MRIKRVMPTDNTPSRPKGEVSGALLLGMIDSFGIIRILPPELIPFEVESLLPDAWYPYDYLIKLNTLIEEQIPHSDSILFWAGVRFIHIWYWQGPGKTMINSSLDWVYCNDKGGGYNSVVRGEKVGWCRNRIVDEAQGFALVENVNPISGSYLRGIFFGGFYLFDDMAYFNAKIDSVSTDPLYPFQCTVIKLIFRQSNPSISATRLEQLSNIEAQADTLSAVEAEEVLWRYRHQLNISKLRTEYKDNVSELAGRAYKSLQKLKDELAAANLQLASEATTDALTGLNNKRYFNQQISRILSAAKRDQHSVCAIMMDIDFFKRFNDHYGHLAGDVAITAVAQCIKSNVSRGNDLVVRFGGEEFVIILVNTDENGVRALVKKIVSALDVRQISHEKSEVCPHLTISIGSAISKNENDTNALLKRADDALYRAKQQGRNCHVHAG
jgi:diguanylate cyclase (GGDEF)-like protein